MYQEAKRVLLCGQDKERFLVLVSTFTVTEVGKIPSEILSRRVNERPRPVELGSRRCVFRCFLVNKNPAPGSGL